MLIQKQQIEIDVTYSEFINLVRASNNYIFQPITPEIAGLSAQLKEKVSLDPADSIIAATSIILRAPLITTDKTLLKSKEIITYF